MACIAVLAAVFEAQKTGAGSAPGREHGPWPARPSGHAPGHGRHAGAAVGRRPARARICSTACCPATTSTPRRMGHLAVGAGVQVLEGGVRSLERPDWVQRHWQRGSCRARPTAQPCAPRVAQLVASQPLAVWSERFVQADACVTPVLHTGGGAGAPAVCRWRAAPALGGNRVSGWRRLLHSAHDRNPLHHLHAPVHEFSAASACRASKKPARADDSRRIPPDRARLRLLFPTRQQRFRLASMPRYLQFPQTAWAQWLALDRPMPRATFSLGLACAHAAATSSRLRRQAGPHGQRHAAGWWAQLVRPAWCRCRCWRGGAWRPVPRAARACRATMQGTSWGLLFSEQRGRGCANCATRAPPESLCLMWTTTTATARKASSTTARTCCSSASMATRAPNIRSTWAMPMKRARAPGRLQLNAAGGGQQRAGVVCRAGEQACTRIPWRRSTGGLARARYVRGRPDLALPGLGGFSALGAHLARLGLPTVFVLEGGYAAARAGHQRGERGRRF